MHKRIRKRKIRKFSYVLLVILLVLVVFLIFKKDKHVFIASDVIEDINIVDDGYSWHLCDVQASNVNEIIGKYINNVSESDRVFPSRDKKVFSGDTIVINREKKLTVKVDGEQKELSTFGDTIENILTNGGIVLDENDIVKPSKDVIVKGDLEVEIIRVEFKEESEFEQIPFKKIIKEDDKLNFLKQFIKQKGQKGKKKIVYKVAYHDGKEVDKKIEREEIIKEPVDEIFVKGTKVKLGKKHSGACSWYSHTGTLSAANQWLPKGSYVKVTNKANGKSVIVQINDRGPFVPGRIIDLDKVAFAKIASLGAGVIDVKIEEIIE
jgi:uncharacterized protein YabE (DUF348 family)